jgi:hypothetical protein
MGRRILSFTVLACRGVAPNARGEDGSSVIVNRFLFVSFSFHLAALRQRLA